ncbi:hypothetical protein CEQ90_00545 [Lewinellaceae bacterium SD302]|nr:hypothetical protein CEQ90_00545 [Lewinellaceae bacterium SD302]
MKYALLSVLFFFFHFTCGLSAQTDTEEDGLYYSSGTVYNGDQLTGYFTLQVGKVDDEILKYTIKLLDRNADQIGKTIYQRKNEFEFQRIFYNGTYLALQLKEGDNPPYVDILDGAGERIVRKTFDHLEEVYLSDLWPVKDGFIFVVSHQMTPDEKRGQRQWTMGLISNDGGKVEWEINSENPPRTSHYLNLLDADNDMLLFSVNEFDETKRKTVRNVGLRAFDPRTGAALFTYYQDDNVWGARDFKTAKITSDGTITALQFYDTSSDRLYVMRNFSREGKKTSSINFALSGLALKDFTKEVKRKYRNNYWAETGHLFTDEGELQLAVQPFRPHGYEMKFNSPHSMVIDTGANRIATKLVKISPFAMQSKFLGISTGFGVLSRKGKGMMQDIRFHGGPFPFAGQQLADNITIQYFFDREFTKEGVKYQSIHAIYYLDGELIEEVIPFESDADMVRIYPGKPGYFLVMEAYSDGSIKTRLERMDF